jgi:hypothetical protein
MLSILIPVYNFDVRNLVYKLNSQAQKAKICFEIILIDDKSTKKFRLINTELRSLKNIIYFELQINVGRSKIRNLLVEKAKFEYLIFMDCDSDVSDNNYIVNYLNYCKGEVLVYGGRTYEKKPPNDKNKYFRWLYGVKREVVSAEIRKLNANNSFMTNNFLINKNLFNKIKFDEKITTYGHEDTIFGFELKKRNIFIRHINNPLIHIGLEDSEIFLKKTKQGIDNLKYLANKFKYENELFEDIKILKYCRIVKKLKLKFLIIIAYNIFKHLIIKNLNGRKPNLKLFDLYKLASILKDND